MTLQEGCALHQGLGSALTTCLWRAQVTLLRHLRHENIIAVRDMMIPPAAQRDKFADVYLVYELMDTDLHQIIRSPQPLSEDHVQYFTYQARAGVGLGAQHETRSPDPPE